MYSVVVVAPSIHEEEVYFNSILAPWYGQSLMNSFSNHYWNIAYRKNSLKQVAMRQGHFFPNGSGKAYLSSALDLRLGSFIETSHT